MAVFGLNTERITIVLGFGLTVCGLFLTQYYLEPAQRQRSDVEEQLATARAKAQVLRAANAMDNIFGQLGSLVFTLNANDQPTHAGSEAVGTLQLRALDWRHDGVRTYIAQLGIAGEMDYSAASATYEKLVADELREGTMAAYQKVNAFEGDLSMKAVTDGGTAAMTAIRLHFALSSVNALVVNRSLILMLVTVVGSTLIFIATLIEISPAGPPSPVMPHTDEALSATVTALETALAEIRRRRTDAGTLPATPPSTDV